MADLVSIGFEISTRGIRAGIQELDRLSDSGDDAQRSIDRFGNQLRESDRAMGRYIDRAGRMREANGRFVASQRAVNRSANGTAGAFKSAAAALGAYISVSSGVGVITGFEDAMLGLQATTRASTEEMVALEKQARTLGATSVFSAEQAANAQKFLAQAGFNSSQILGSTAEVLNLAAAGSIDLATAADIASNVLGGMNLEVSELGRVSDVMAEAAAASNTNIQQLGEALSTAAPLAATAGASIEETTAAIGKLSDAGLQGSRAGTGLLGVIRQLSNVTDGAKEALNSYGLSIEDVNINNNGLANVLEKLEKANISTADSFAIFGSEAAPAALILANNAKKAEELTERLEESDGAAKEMADILSSGLSASLKSFNSQLSESVLQLGEGGVGGAIQSVVDSATGLLAVYNGMTEEFAEANELTKDQVENLESIATALSVTATAAASGALAYKGYTTAVTLATAAQRGFNFAVRVNPIGAALSVAAALGGVMFTLTNNTDSAADAVKKLTDETLKLDKAQRMLAINEAEKEKIKLQKELANVIKQQTVEQERFNKQLDIYAANAELDSFREPITNPFSEEDIKTVDKYGERIATLKQGILELDEAIKKASTFEMAPIEATVSPKAVDFGADQYKQFADAVKTTSDSDTSGLLDWESIGEEAAQTIGQSLADGDFSDFGDALGSAAASAIGSAVTAGLASSLGPFSAVAGGLASGVVSGIIGGKKQTGSSTTVSLSGGQASGFNQKNFSGLFGSSSSRQDLGSGAISALNNSASMSLSAIDNALLAMGSTITTTVDDFSTTVKVGEGDFTDAIEDITANYISANFAAIEDYSRAGETFVQTFERINEEMVSVIDSFSLNTGSGSFQAASDAYIETQSDIIEQTTTATISASRAAAASIEKQIEDLNKQYSFLDSEDSGQRAAIRSQLDQLRDELDNYNQIIAEQASRLGSSLQTATVDFSNAVLESIATIEGISSDDAVGKLNQLTASYEENYFTLTEQTERAIESARKELEEFADLGIDETTSLDEFQSAFESFVNSDAFTPEGYSQWLLAADALADLNNVVDEIDSSGTFESITDFVKDLMGLAADGTETLAAATAQYQETLALAQTGDADALAALTTDAQSYLDAVERSASTGADVIIARSQVASDLSGTVPAFATGGTHAGGLRLVGENGPEIEATGPSRIFSNSDTKKMLDNTETTKEISMMRSDMGNLMSEIAKNTSKSYKLLDRWDGQGLPKERSF